MRVLYVYSTASAGVHVLQSVSLLLTRFWLGCGCIILVPLVGVQISLSGRVLPVKELGLGLLRLVLAWSFVALPLTADSSG